MSDIQLAPRQSVILSAEHRTYAENSYPSNHNFKIGKNTLKPKCKLAVRYRKIRKYYPASFSSFLDLSCSRGYFVFSASSDYHSTRNLGIDVNEYDINFCQQLKKYLHNNTVDFKRLQLHELADQIDIFGGPFETVLLINTYQYLYFGSGAAPACYHDHDEIFKNMRKVCNGRVIFNNRVELEDCQGFIQKSSQQYADQYTSQKILAAASRYFKVTEHGAIGRYPLWLMDVK